MLALQASRRVQQLAQRRTYIWVPASVKPLANTNHMPFNFPIRSKPHAPGFALKFCSVFAVGLLLPVIAVSWQWYKPGGLKNP
ncbi:hypothetical protein BDZ89DRAFT_1061088 [Hymenopellis radicata]|nr:hypothetical protein BDZ89DRAFT_1061088 [Hymenopellis radicata]